MRLLGLVVYWRFGASYSLFQPSPQQPVLPLNLMQPKRSQPLDCRAVHILHDELCREGEIARQLGILIDGSLHRLVYCCVRRSSILCLLRHPFSVFR
jgi:hypothetical protein